MEMISKSTQALLPQSSAVRAMSEEGERLGGEYGSDRVYDFGLGNPNVPAPAEMEQTIREVLTEELSAFVHDYMSNAGFADLRTTITGSLQECFGLAYRADQLITTTGAAAVLNILLKTVLDPGGEVLTFAFYFSEYEDYTQNYDGTLCLVATDPKISLSDLDAFRKAIGEGTCALILNMSNNPGGVIYSEGVFRGIRGVLAEKERGFGSCILVTSDEPYRKLVYDGAVVPWIPALMPYAAVVYSYFKVLSPPGERTGWLPLSGSTPEAHELCVAMVITGRISDFVNASSLIQRMLKRTSGCRVDFPVYEHNWVLLLREFPKTEHRLVEPEGVFYLLIQTPEGDDAAFATTLKEERILAMPCKSFTRSDYVRLAYCVAEMTVRSAFPGFRRAAEFYKVKGLL